MSSRTQLRRGMALKCNLCAFVLAKNGSLPLGCYQCSASGEADVCSSSFGMRMGAQRAGPHVQAFSCSRIDN